MTKHKTPTTNRGNNKQWINNNRITTLEQTAAEATGGKGDIYWPNPHLKILLLFQQKNV